VRSKVIESVVCFLTVLGFFSFVGGAGGAIDGNDPRGWILVVCGLVVMLVGGRWIKRNVVL